MAPTNRVGTGLLGTFSLALAALMAYTLAFEGCHGTEPSENRHPVEAEVAVFFPDRGDWSHFRHAVDACVRRGLAGRVGEGERSVVVATPGLGRRVRFSWHGIRGVGETRDEVDRLAKRERPPVAVVGSTTTVLTVALAEPLRDEGATGPVLLVPWATAVMSPRPGAGENAAPLLGIDPGRTFRFCPNNRRLAESVVDCLIDQEAKKPPGQAFLVVDPHDPYSVDLADCFRRAIRARAGTIEIVEKADAVDMPSVARSPGALVTPSSAEASLADAIVTASEESPGDRTTWVILPLQGEPTRRLLAALQSRSSWHSDEGDGPIRVVCGDGIGRETLDRLAGRRSLPIWCASTSSARSPEHGVTNDTQTLAEIVSAVLLAVERSPRAVPSPDEVREALTKIDMAADDPSAFGRPLRFDREGERRDDPGYVLAVRPGLPAVSEFVPDRTGRWVETGTIGSAMAGARP